MNQSVRFKILNRDDSHKSTFPFESSKASVMCLVSVVYPMLSVGVTDVQLYMYVVSLVVSCVPRRDREASEVSHVNERNL